MNGIRNLRHLLLVAILLLAGCEKTTSAPALRIGHMNCKSKKETLQLVAAAFRTQGAHVTTLF